MELEIEGSGQKWFKHMLTQPLNQNEQNDVCCKFTTFHIIQVAEVFNQERAFASVRLPQAGMEVKKNNNNNTELTHCGRLHIKYNLNFVSIIMHSS